MQIYTYRYIEIYNNIQGLLMILRKGEKLLQNWKQTVLCFNENYDTATNVILNEETSGVQLDKDAQNCYYSSRENMRF